MDRISTFLVWDSTSSESDAVEIDAPTPEAAWSIYASSRVLPVHCTAYVIFNRDPDQCASWEV